jgi:hypothetical protein
MKTGVVQLFLLALPFIASFHRLIPATSLLKQVQPCQTKVARGIYNARCNKLKILYFKTSENDGVGVMTAPISVENDDDDDEEEDGSKRLSIRRKLSKAIVPLAASLGFAITRSPTIAVRIAGGVAGGVVGLFAKKALLAVKSDEEKDDHDGSNGGGRSQSVVSSLNTLRKVPDIASLVDLKSLEKIAKRNSVPTNELSIFFTYTLMEAILQAVQPDDTNLTELSDVMAFATQVGFTPSEIGDALALAAINIGKRLKKNKKGFYKTEYPINIYLQAAKLFFLADKMIGSLHDGFYNKRIQIAMNYFPIEDYQETISEACEDLFRRCVESVFLQPGDFTQQELAELRSFLTTSASASTLRPANMQNMIMEAIQFLLDSSLMGEEMTPMTASIQDLDKLQTAQQVFGWNERELRATIETRTIPIFKSIVVELLTAVAAKPEHAVRYAEDLIERIESLDIDPNKAKVYLTTSISKMNQEYMDSIEKVYDAAYNALEPVYKMMISYAHTHAAFNAFISHIFPDYKLPLPGLPFAEMIRSDVYRLKLEQGQDGANLDDEIFNLSPAQQQLVKKNMALPKLTSWITTCIKQDNYHENAKKAYQNILTEFAIGETEWKPSVVDFYYQEVSKVASSKAIPTLDDIKRLDMIRSFLECDDATVRNVHLELFGDKYVKALTESMTPSGVITEEYVAGLQRLRDRLGLNKEDADRLLSITARQRINPIIRDLVDIWKSDTDANYRREKAQKGSKDPKSRVEKDKSRDPISSVDNVFGFMEMGGPGQGAASATFMREVVNLVDFVQDSFIAQGIDLSSQTPITVVGIVAGEDIIGIYKHFLLTRLAEKDLHLRTRYHQIEDLLVKILGIEDPISIKESLAFSAFRSLLRNTLSYKGLVSNEDLRQFAILKEGLQLSEDTAEDLYTNACKSALFDHTSQLLSVDGKMASNTMTPAMAKQFREQVRNDYNHFSACVYAYV